MKYPKLLLLYLLPKNLLSYIVGILTSLKLPQFILKPLIATFVRAYKVSMNEAVPAKYRTFNEFFTRALRPECRPIDEDTHSIVSPVDGIVGYSGEIKRDTLIQAKGREYSLDAFVANKEYAEIFRGGVYMTIYLSPSHYHRIHTPVAGKVTSLNYIPGKLYPVNPFAINNIDHIFSKNERLISIIESDTAGKVAVVKVGATNVGKIKVVYDSVTSNNFWRKGVFKTYEDVNLQKCEELGRFELGSTVVLLFEKGKVKLTQDTPESDVLLGQKIAEVCK
ncbi:archaetidylserine decarboxylase [Candidatus Uabimicrobium amorphum]|uniref:Phosphatidylserine decarboxylase proenzyme n=1 Tax=Uabimicrobium amorphum TaxID=2596890 RepID=A0A5S9IUT0_UABAM|nr:archaetidylserine decarboxylase [Candidatus Uabimicrobium amorphum]BBM87921.1 phosphatidylserine decarboxylase proenzyme [Candidatus Uabimicrobium amorphum]